MWSARPHCDALVATPTQTTFWRCWQESCTTKSRHSVAACASLWVKASSSPFHPPRQRSAPPLHIQMALLKRNTADPQRAVEIRIGIHTGQVTEQDGDLYGQAVHAAARVTGQAAGGQILTSEEVREDAEPLVDWPFLDSGLFWLRGFPERWRLYEVSWNDTGPGCAQRWAAPLTPFIGREVERASLRRLVDDALAGDGRLALVAGEPGIGKSRLVSEIGKEAKARGMRVLTGHCVEMSGAPPYLPYVEMIEQAIDNPRSPLALREALGDVAAEIARIAPALRRVFPDIPPPIELPAELAAPLRVEQFQRVHRPRSAEPALIAGAGGSALGRRVNPATHRVSGAAVARDAGAGARHIPRR